MSGTHRRLAIVVFALAMPLFAGCGSGGRGAAPVAATATATSALAATLVHAVRAQRTAKVSIDISEGSISVGETSLAGTVDYGSADLQAELSGKVRGQPVQMIIIGSALYVSGLTELPAGKAWQRSTVGNQRPFMSTWNVLDQIASSLTHAVDERLLDGVRYNDAPPQDLDGTSVRGSLVTVTRDAFVQRLPAAQRDSYDAHFEGFDGARLQCFVDAQNLPRRLIVTLSGERAYPTVGLLYSAWGSAVSITAPAAGQVMELPAT